MPQLSRFRAGPPNPPMQLTPLRVREIAAFVKRRIGPKSVPMYRWRRN
jgi:hypothetical protein